MSTLRFKKAEVEKVVKDLPDEAEIMLVGDQGIYLMSFTSAAENRPIAYAEECNPEKTKDWYEAKRTLYGGDDGGDVVGTAAQFKSMLKIAKKNIVIKLTPDSILVLA